MFMFSVRLLDPFFLKHIVLMVLFIMVYIYIYIFKFYALLRWDVIINAVILSFVLKSVFSFIEFLSLRDVSLVNAQIYNLQMT